LTGNGSGSGRKLPENAVSGVSIPGPAMLGRTEERHPPPGEEVALARLIAPGTTGQTPGEGPLKILLGTPLRGEELLGGEGPLRPCPGLSTTHAPTTGNGTAKEAEKNRPEPLQIKLPLHHPLPQWK